MCHHQSIVVLFIAMFSIDPRSSNPLHNRHCQHQYSHELPQQSSAWQEFLQSGIFSPSSNDQSRHHLRRLRHKIAELVAVIQHTKNEVSQELFSDPYHQVDSELQQVRFDLFQSQESSEDDFSEAYLTFQKLHLSTEIILHDLKHEKRHPGNRHKINQIWRTTHNLIFNIIKNLYTELNQQELPVKEPLSRSVIPGYYRCVQHSSYRDIRDFVTMRHVLEEATRYLDKFD